MIQAPTSGPVISGQLARHPAMEPYQELLQRLPAVGFPSAAELQDLLAVDCRNAQGQHIRLVESHTLPELSGDGAYEREIARSGRVSTRPGSLHDLCNALVWARFPLLKAVLNQRHLEALPDSTPGRRGPVRDALTLFDECGMVVTCTETGPLEALAAHDWGALFGNEGELWSRETSVWMVGHGNLEQLAEPFPGLISQCLLLHTPRGTPTVKALDQGLACLWRSAAGPASPADLCAFPFAGIPGWWRGNQDPAFYRNQEVFRPPRPGRSVPPVWSLPH